MSPTCPHCAHRWEGESVPGMVCPKCGKAVFPGKSPVVDPEARTAGVAPGVDPNAPTEGPPPCDADSPTPIIDANGPTDAVDILFDDPDGSPSPSPGGSSKTRSGVDMEQMEALVGTSLGGYRVQALLGVGGMGAVFQARQLSLDRDVALKVLPHRLADRPDTLSRFIREALSAAQLTHHNVVQVYDVGNDLGEQYISMEFVRGRTISDVIRRDGRLTVDDAAGYALQAARGLAYAHDCGIIHRDIKPDNLMLNGQGVVKIADMGLAKIIGVDEDDEEGGYVREELKKARADLTIAHRGMGTPSYMPPEQARDARSVDARADQYSLGCTLYYMCAGRAPYTGATAYEVITKHLKEPLPPLDIHVQNVPSAFQAIIERMVAKKPEDRYPDMHAVVADLENYLGVDSEKGPYRPREHHLAALDEAREAFCGAPLVGVRRAFTLTFFALCAILVLLSPVMGGFGLAGFAIGLVVLTSLCHFVIHGVATHGYLFHRVRSLFFGMPLRSWAILAGSLVATLLVLFILQWLLVWGGVAVLSLGLAFGCEFGVSRRLRAQRAAVLEKMHGLLRELRLKGLSEEALQQFVRRFSKGSWEEFFEALFGYEAMVAARERWAPADDVQTSRRRFAPWRDPLARWLDRVEDARKRARERRELERVEAARLKAEGMAQKEAEAAARREADAFRKDLNGQADRASEKRQARKRKQADRHPESQYVQQPPRRVRWMGIPYRLARAAVGVALIALWIAGRFLGVLPEWASNMADGVFTWGQGGLLAGAVGLLVLLSAFSGRLVAPTIVLLGALLVLAYRPIVAMVDNDRFTEAIAFWGGVALIVGAFAALILGLLSRRRR